jgi:hypothetical protein
MISPLRIALQGLHPGGAPLEIAAQGLLVTITPAPLPEEDSGLWHPLRAWGPARPRRDAVVDVQGCRVNVTCTSDNIAKINPTTTEQDRLDDVAFRHERRRAAREAAEDREEEIAFLVWEYFYDKRAEEELAGIKAKHFREDVSAMAAQLEARPSPHTEIAGLIVGLTQELHRLQEKIENLEAGAAIKPPRQATKK